MSLQNSFGQLLTTTQTLESVCMCKSDLQGTLALTEGFPGCQILKMHSALICKENVENVNHFLLECREFRNNFDSIWLNLRQKIVSVGPNWWTSIFFILFIIWTNGIKFFCYWGDCNFHLIVRVSPWLRGSYVPLSIRCSTSEKRNCVSRRHHGSLNKSFFH